MYNAIASQSFVHSLNCPEMIGNRSVLKYQVLLYPMKATNRVGQSTKESHEASEPLVLFPKTDGISSFAFLSLHACKSLTPGLPKLSEGMQS